MTTSSACSSRRPLSSKNELVRRLARKSTRALGAAFYVSMWEVSRHLSRCGRAAIPCEHQRSLWLRPSLRLQPASGQSSHRNSSHSTRPIVSRTVYHSPARDASSREAIRSPDTGRRQIQLTKNHLVSGRNDRSWIFCDGESKMLMRTEQPRRGQWRAPQKMLNLLCDPDFVAVAYFAALGILITITLARIFPLDHAINLLMLSD
jgi:hypothetical protein